LSAAPDISALIVSFNSRDRMPACLESLEAARGALALEVVVVDNASTDGTAELLAATPGVRVLRNATNEGFARAMNRALREAAGRHLLWLNPDCRLEAGSLPAALRRLESLGEPAVLGPRLLGPTGVPQPSALSFHSPLSAVLHALNARGLLRLPGARGLAGPLARALGRGPLADYLATSATRPALRRVDWLTGACLLMSAEAARRVGPLDEDFFMYSEDEAWCRRAKALGVARVWDPEWTAHHEVGGSGGGSPYIQCHFYRSLWLYHRKFTGAGRPLVAAALVSMFLARAAADAVRGALGAVAARRRCGLWLGLARWVLAGGSEPCGPVPPPPWPPTEGFHAP
jgi:N-acetylglucosaminyl-diphospho-decaprenol L-rhamnosyltransferase